FSRQSESSRSRRVSSPLERKDLPIPCSITESYSRNSALRFPCGAFNFRTRVRCQNWRELLFTSRANFKTRTLKQIGEFLLLECSFISRGDGPRQSECHKLISSEQCAG